MTSRQHPDRRREAPTMRVFTGLTMLDTIQALLVVSLDL